MLFPSMSVFFDFTEIIQVFRPSKIMCRINKLEEFFIIEDVSTISTLHKAARLIFAEVFLLDQSGKCVA